MPKHLQNRQIEIKLSYTICYFPYLTHNTMNKNFSYTLEFKNNASFINCARLLLKSFRELLSQFASVYRTQEEQLLLVISVIYLPNPKPRKLLWRYSILNAHCKHMIFLFEKFFKAETACRMIGFVIEIFNLLIIRFYSQHICSSY